MYKGILIITLLLGLLFEETKAQVKVHLPPTATTNTVVHFADGVVADSAQGFPISLGIPSGDMNNYNTLGRRIAYMVYDITNHKWVGYDPITTTWSPIGGGAPAMAADSGFIPYANYAGAGMALTNKFRYDTAINSLRLQTKRIGGTGVNNLFFGEGSLQNITAGSANTAIGDSTLYSNTTGSNNIAIGNMALKSNQTGSYNVVIGSGSDVSGTSSWNVAIGYQTMNINTTGNQNVAIGYNTMKVATTANVNTGVGISSLFGLTTGSANTAIGVNSGFGISTGSNNIAIGRSSLRVNTTAQSNVSIGDSSTYGQLSGNFNTAVGVGTLYGVPTNYTGGHGNTVMGWRAGYSAGQGNFNTFLGYNAGSAVSIATNSILIGANTALPNGNAANQLNIGNMLYSRDGVRVGVFNNNPVYPLSVTGKGGFSDTLFTKHIVDTGSVLMTYKNLGTDIVRVDRMQFSIEDNSLAANAGLLVPRVTNPNYTRLITVSPNSALIAIANGNVDNGGGLARDGSGNVGNYATLRIFSNKTTPAALPIRSGQMVFQTDTWSAGLVTRLSLDSNEVRLPTIQQATTSNILYYNSADGKVTYGNGSITATLDFPSTTQNTSSDLTIAAPGALIGDIVTLGIPAVSVVPGSVYMAWVSAPDVITVRLANLTNGGEDPVSGVFKIRVMK